MVHSPMYHRLMRFVEDAKANEALADYDSQHRSTLEAMREAQEYIEHFRQYQGFQGQTGDAIDKWLEGAEHRLELWRSSYLATTQVEVEMRRVMQHAREEAEMLSPVLVDARLDKLRDEAEVTIPVMEQYGLVGKAFNAVASTGAAVYDAIATQANNDREAASTDILQRLNDSMQGLANNATRIKELQEELKSRDRKKWDPGELPQPSDPSVADQLEKGIKDVSSHSPGVYPGNRDTDYGRSDGRGPNSGLYPNGFDNPTSQDADAEKLRKLQSGRIPDRFNSEGEPGSRSNPITDPEDLKDIDLLHSRIGGERYANGLTRGGYTPAPPSDRYHPLWNINGGPSTHFDASGRTSHAGAGALGAGVLGAGALGAAALGARGASRLGAGAGSSLGRGGAGGLGSAGRSGIGGISASGRGGAGAGGLGASGRGGAGAGGLGGLRGGSASGGRFGSNGLAGSASASGGTTGLTGTKGIDGAAEAAGKTSSGSAASGTGASGRPGMGGFMGAGAGAGAGGGKDDKKGRRHKYTAFKFEDDDEDGLPPGYVNPMSQTYGSDKDLKPASQKDDGWDPRQW